MENQMEFGITDWDLAIHGDLLERTAIDFIRGRIPLYEETWKKYIGHQGNGMPANLCYSQGDIIDSEHDLANQRQFFAQYHYTILESLYGCKRIIDDSMRRNINNIFLILDDILLFHTYLGRICDSIERASNQIGINFEEKDLEDKEIVKSLTKNRNPVMHGPHVPIRADKNNNDKIYISNSWDDKTGKWTNTLQSDETIDLEKYFEDKFSLAIIASNKWFGRFNSKILDICRLKQINLYQPSVTIEQTPNPYNSGSASGFTSLYTFIS